MVLHRSGQERPRLLDLCCCAGGATRGYQRAGFEVIGVDIAPQPHYIGDRFIQADAMQVLDALPFLNVQAVHASPPCQTRTAYKRRGGGVGEGYADLIEPMQTRLREAGLPYVIENVPTAPLKDPVTLCGSSFGLDVRRHRLFETNWTLTAPPCDHRSQAPGRFPGATNRAPMSRATCEVGVWRIPLETQKRAMGVDWKIELRELSESLPPAYTEHIGRQLMTHLYAANRKAA